MRSRSGALARADEAGDDRHVIADHVVEKERRLRLVDQGGDMANVDRLMQVDQFAVLPQSIEELAEVFLQVDPTEFSLRLMSAGARDNVYISRLQGKGRNSMRLDANLCQKST
jgi:hypothetical protein